MNDQRKLDGWVYDHSFFGLTGQALKILIMFEISIAILTLPITAALMIGTGTDDSEYAGIVFWATLIGVFVGSSFLVIMGVQLWSDSRPKPVDYGYGVLPVVDDKILNEYVFNPAYSFMGCNIFYEESGLSHQQKNV